MAYVDIFVASIQPSAREAYLAHCRQMAEVTRAAGATRVVECWGEDVKHGKLTDFYMAVQANEGESVITGWIEWPSKAARDAGWEKVMADPSMQPGAQPMPFDGKKMIYGGFDVILDKAG